MKGRSSNPPNDFDLTNGEHRRQLVPVPAFRKLRVFAIDPGLNARFETAVMNEMTLRIPWEKLEPGPLGEYVRVVDIDAYAIPLYDPVNLDSPDLLAQDGLSPSDGDPHFHQQMVYAVAMRTIRTFERALGRLTHWPQKNAGGGSRKVAYEPRVMLVPHYAPEPNSYHVLGSGDLYFGYFESGPNTPIPNTHIFTCLSQDLIAHELDSFSCSSA